MPLLTGRYRNPITAPQQDAMRASLDTIKQDVCTIERASQTSDNQGGVRDTWANQTTGVACYLRPTMQAGPEAAIAEKLTVDQAWAVVVPAETDVTPRDRIVVTSTTPNRRFEVVGVLAPHTYEVDRVCVCSELT